MCENKEKKKNECSLDEHCYHRKEKEKVSRDRMQLMVEGLLSMGKDLGSIPSTAKRK